MTSVLSNQEKLKDKISSAGKDEIFGNEKEHKQIYKVKNSNGFKKEGKFSNTPIQLFKENLFEIKETPIKQKIKNKNIERHGKYFIIKMF